MGTITQIQCDIDGCFENAAFTGVDTLVKSGSNLSVKKMDLCSKHKQQLLALAPLTDTGANKIVFSSTVATR